MENYSTRIGADLLISKGLIKINGETAVLGDKVYEGDTVTVDKNIKQKEYVYFAYNKPVGITTNKDSFQKNGRVAGHILSTTKFTKKDSENILKVFPVGRLDKDSHGLIIMTNDGRVTDKLLSPKYIHEKEYIVKTELPFSDGFLNILQNGVAIGGYRTQNCKAWRKEGTKNMFHIILTEGKKRQIRRMCEALHHKVIDLKRVRVMNIELGDTKQGSYREIKGSELKNFLSLLKI